MRVNHFNVGWVLTPNEYQQKIADGLPPDWPEHIEPQYAPSGRIMPPEEIAAAAVYWLSDESRPISGSVVELEQYPIIGRNPTKKRATDAASWPRFPRLTWMHAVRHDGTMTIRQWIELGGHAATSMAWSSTPAFSNLQQPAAWAESRRIAADHGLDDPDALLLARLHASRSRVSPAADRPAEKAGSTCAPSSAASTAACSAASAGPKSRATTALRYAAESIEACLPHAAACGVTLILENHYKDNYWQYPEFAQKMDVFCDLVDASTRRTSASTTIPATRFLAGEDPLELLRRVKHRVVTMHASDRYLAEGTLEDLRREEDSVGYAKRLRHGVIGRGHERLRRDLQRAGRRRLRRLDQHRRRRRRHRRTARKRRDFYARKNSDSLVTRN